MPLSLPRVFALLTCLLAPAVSAAVEVAGLFEASVPVANQGAGERGRATVEGFRQVLVKASGQRSVLDNPAVQQELGKAESLVGSYRYETPRHEGAGLPAPSARGAAVAEPGQAAPHLRLKFDPGSVLGVLNRAAAPVWGATRPQVYLWVLREGPAPQVFALGTAQGDALLDAASRRGLPVAIPAPGDLPVSALSSGVPEAVADMATRVGAQVILAASATTAPGRVRVTGVIRVEGVEQRIEASGPGEDEALRELVEQAADALGGRYAVVARQDQVSAVALRVDGVGTLADWAALERWLASQPLIKDAVVSRVDMTGTDFTLLLSGDLGRLLQAMRADGRFAAVGEPVADGAMARIVATLAAAPAP